MAPSADPPSPLDGRVLEASTRQSPFSIENIPFGIISTESDPRKRCATAYEGWAVDLEVLEYSGLFAGIPDLTPGIFSSVSTNTSSRTHLHS